MSDDTIEEMIERDRGFLTRSDREFLLGENELSGVKERKKRYRIRNRIQNAVKDFLILDISLDDQTFSIEDLRKTMADVGFGAEEIDSELAYGLEALFYTLFWAVDERTFSRQFRRGVADAYEDQSLLEKDGFPDYGLGIHFSTEGYGRNLEELQEAFEDGEELTHRELLALSRWGLVSVSDAKEAIKRKPDEVLAKELLHYRGVAPPYENPTKELKRVFGITVNQWLMLEVEML